MEINDQWEPQVKEAHLRDQEQTARFLIDEVGRVNAAEKIQNFIDLGDAPFSIISNHNKFLRQIRYAFVISAFYPALTGACALGERILNNLLLKLRDYYKATPEYKKIYRKDSFDNWSVVIDTLEAWGVLQPQAVIDFRKLAILRNKAIHFDPDTDNNDRELALGAIKTLSAIIGEQLPAFAARPWFISNTPGVCFIKKEAESNPFIKEFYLPNCRLVGPYHTIEFQEKPEEITVILNDRTDYENREITDEEFADLYNNQHLNQKQ